MDNKLSMGDEFLADINLIIEDNIGNENFTVSDLAKEAGLSRSMLHRKLIRLTGLSATQLITEIRLKRARELIEKEVATISEIAYMVGFKSPSYFNRVFKKIYHVSPGELRKKVKGKSSHLTVVRNRKGPDSGQSKKSGIYFILWTKIFTVILVSAAAAFLVYEVFDMLSLILGFPQRTKNIMFILLCSGAILAVFLSWIYHLQSALGNVKLKPSSIIKEAEKLTISKRWKIGAYLSIGIIIILISMNLFQKNNEIKNMELPARSIAVLPFQIENPDPDMKYFCNGLEESILNSLSSMEGLIVTFQASGLKKLDPGISIPELAEILDVNYFLLGSLQKYGEHIRMTIRLIDKQERQLWSEQYDRVIKHSEENYKLQSDIASQVASIISAEMRSISP